MWGTIEPIEPLLVIVNMLKDFFRSFQQEIVLEDSFFFHRTIAEEQKSTAEYAIDAAIPSNIGKLGQ